MTVKYQLDGGVLTLTLDRPDKLNAFTGKMAKDIIAALDKADADDAVRAIIFTGAGRAYCAGADLSGGAKTFDYDQAAADKGKANTSADSKIARDGGGLVTLRMYDCKKPIIGAINGAAVGIGVTMTLAMDIRLASEKARFGFVFAKRGIVPEAASSWFLPRIVGISQALQWTYSGKIFDASEALNGGLVSEVLPAEDLLTRAREIADEIANETAPVSVTLIRQMMWKGLGMEHPMQAHCVDSKGVYYTGRSDDAKEGVMSFLEKRPAKYTGRASDLPPHYPWWQQPEYE